MNKNFKRMSRKIFIENCRFRPLLRCLNEIVDKDIDQKFGNPKHRSVQYNKTKHFRRY